MLLNEENSGLRTNLYTVPVFFEECEHLTSPPTDSGDYTPCRLKSRVTNINTLSISFGPLLQTKPMVSRTAPRRSRLRTAVCAGSRGTRLATGGELAHHMGEGGRCQLH